MFVCITEKETSVLGRIVIIMFVFGKPVKKMDIYRFKKFT